MNYFKKYLKVAPFSHALWRSLEARALGRIKIKPPVLDIGCGLGEFAGVFFPNLVEIGVDINIKDLLIASQKKKYRKLVMADARNLPFPDKSFKTIIAISTLEHIEGVDQVFKEGYRVLRKNGLFIYTVPTKAFYQMLFFPQIFHFVFKHKAILDEAEWLKLTQKAGFKIVHKQGTVSEKQVKFFESGLPFAFFTQINLFLFKKRLLFSPKWRVEWLARLFKNLILEKKTTPANILVVARK